MIVRAGVFAEDGGIVGDLGDLVFGLKLDGLGGVDSPVDVKSRCVTFNVPIYLGMNGNTRRQSEKNTCICELGRRHTLRSIYFDILVESIFLFNKWFTDCMSTEFE